MTFRTLALATLLFTPVLGACGSRSCPQGITPGIVIEVRDAITGAPAASGTTARILRGTIVVDSLTRPSGAQGESGLELTSFRTGPGTYRIVIDRPGYQSFSQDGVIVRSTGGACNANITTRVQVSLQPVS